MIRKILVIFFIMFVQISHGEGERVKPSIDFTGADPGEIVDNSADEALLDKISDFEQNTVQVENIDADDGGLFQKSPPVEVTCEACVENILVAYTNDECLDLKDCHRQQIEQIDGEFDDSVDKRKTNSRVRSGGKTR